MEFVHSRFTSLQVVPSLQQLTERVVGDELRGDVAFLVEDHGVHEIRFLLELIQRLLDGHVVVGEQVTGHAAGQRFGHDEGAFFDFLDNGGSLSLLNQKS